MVIDDLRGNLRVFCGFPLLDGAPHVNRPHAARCRPWSSTAGGDI